MMKKILAFSIILSLLVSMIGFVSEGKQKHLQVPLYIPAYCTHRQISTRMTQMVNAGTQPYLDGYNQLANSTLSSSNWTPRATATIIRGGTGDNVTLLSIDVARAYQNALLWKITGNTANGDTARNILNDWSSTLTIDHRGCRTLFGCRTLRISNG